MVLVRDPLLQRNLEHQIKKSAIIVDESNIKAEFHLADIHATPTSPRNLIIMHIGWRILGRDLPILKLFNIRVEQSVQPVCQTTVEKKNLIGTGGSSKVKFKILITKNILIYRFGK